MKIKVGIRKYVWRVGLVAMIAFAAILPVVLSIREEAIAVPNCSSSSNSNRIDTKGGQTLYLSGSQCSTYYRWLNDASGLEENGSVIWAAATKAKYPSDNVCSLWLGEENRPGNGEPIEVDMNQVRDGKYWIGVWGMCTKSDGSNTAVNVRVQNDSSVVVKQTTLGRVGWGNASAITSAFGGGQGRAYVDVEKFKASASKTDLGNGRAKYSKVVSIYRCHTDDGVTSNGNCSEQDVTIELIITTNAGYYGWSKVSSSTGAEAQTDITNTYQNRSAGTIRLDLKSNPTLSSINFYHNVYADAVDGKTAKWEVRRSGNGWSYFSNSGGSGARAASFSDGNKSEGYFIGGPRSGGYIYSSSVNNLRFSWTGTFNFCESLYVNDKQVTQVCQQVVVYNTPTPQNDCSGWAPSSYNRSSSYSGTTSVVTKVYNSSLRGAFSGWRGVVDEGTYPSGGPASISMDAYAGDWEDERVTYAMPTDQIQWKSCYFPGVQTTAFTWRTYQEGAHGTEYNTYNYNDYASSERFGSWYNSYTTSRSSGLVATNGMSQAEYAKGNYWSVGTFSSRYTTTRYDVGRYYQQIITSKYPVYQAIDPSNHCWSGPNPCGCPYCCSWTSCCCGRYCESDCTCCAAYCCRPCTYCHYYYSGWLISRISGPVVSNAAVKIPYNFTNRTNLTVSSDEGNIVYAGGTVRVNSANVEVRTRYNSVTERTYATRVDNAAVKLTAYVSSGSGGSERTVAARNGRDDDICVFLSAKQCSEVSSYEGTLNSSGTLGLNSKVATTEDHGMAGTYNVFDASAGDYMCFVLSVYPASSGTDKMMQSSGDDRWFISAPKCVRIAKKPSVQVWGGNVYSNGDMSSYVSQKHNLYQISRYNPTSSGVNSFGSWVEEGILANGTITGVASGAAMGRNGTSSVYGTTSYDFCTNQIALTIANYSTRRVQCGNNSTNGGNANIYLLTNLRTALVDYLLPSNLTDIGTSSVYLSSDTGYEIENSTGRNMRYVYRNGGFSISGGYVNANELKVVKINGNVSINGSIKYSEDTVLSSIWQAPKAVIYASGNIYISCNVSQVDAILIAGGTVYTCDTYSGSDGSSGAGYRSNQLKINGVVIANKVELGRTYGAAVGDKSGEPAEIFNYDTSGLLWEYSMSSAGESGTMTTVYVHELAPRY
ncbi:hypothetical protein IJG90_00640 [Candidatus Saccharibacteria bacterium]|nr:hypothetical protein [Candidatus Saccharibacteria bacterium]